MDEAGVGHGELKCDPLTPQVLIFSFKQPSLYEGARSIPGYAAWDHLEVAARSSVQSQGVRVPTLLSLNGFKQNGSMFARIGKTYTAIFRFVASGVEFVTSCDTSMIHKLCIYAKVSANDSIFAKTVSDNTFRS